MFTPSIQPCNDVGGNLPLKQIMSRFIDQENGYGFATIQAIQPFLKACDTFLLCGCLSLIEVFRQACTHAADILLRAYMFEIARSGEHEQRSKDDQRKPEREKDFPEESVHRQVRE